MTLRSDDGVLPGFGPAPEPEPAPKMTPGERAADRIAHGIHPATKLALAGNGKTCGDCARLWDKWTPSGKHFYKCASMEMHNDGPDITKSWPACSLFKQKEVG